MKTPLSLLPLSLIIPSVLGKINWDVFEYGVVDSFKWSRPFPDDGTDPGGFHVNCKDEKEFHAKMYKLSDLPHDLAPWHDAIEDFLGQRDYVGTWDGVDHKGQDREIVVMDYVDVPVPVRNWIEEQQQDTRDSNQNKWLFGIFEKPQKEGDKIHGTVKPKPTASPAADADHHGGGEIEKVRVVPDKDKIVVFPGGAVYEIMPLWLAEGSKCKREFSNLEKFKPSAIDHCVIAWVTDHTKPDRNLGKRDITFKIEAMAVTETAEGKYSRLMWEKMHRAVKRNDRRMQKEERLKARREMEQGIVRDKDEL